MTKSKNKGATKSAFINSPLNYQGSKFGLLEQIIPLFPKDIVNFHDVFAGGASVAVNVNAQKTFINDKQRLLWDFYLYLYLFKKRVSLNILMNWSRNLIYLRLLKKSI